MISTTINIPRLGMTFDCNEELIVATDYDYDDFYSDVNSFASRYLSSTTTTFTFPDGSTLRMHNAEYTITRQVDLVEGKMYHMGKAGKKWLALCKFDEKFDELTLFPTERRKYAPLVRNSDRMDYEFYEELDADFKGYL